MDDSQYRDRYVHEFGEDMGAYQDAAKQEAAESVDAMDDEAFASSYGNLPDSDDPHVALEDEEALEGYRHIANGDWNSLNRGQIIALYRLVETMQQHGSDVLEAGKDRYESLQRNMDELEYVMTEESKLEGVEEDYTTFER
jgi:hypothetical protein